ncbi:MAG: hydrogenase [Chlamydiae bacterium]|nr:hydrogenase [Chlamydiota bacterium]MBI3276319.1 hydrogenase [Chlamydiota bacterium]
MNPVWLDRMLAVIVVSAICLLGISRIGSIIKLFAIQSLVLSIIPFLMNGPLGVHRIALALVTFFLKVIIIPMILFWAVRHVAIRRDSPGLFGISISLLLGGFLVGLSFFLSSCLVLSEKPFSDLLIPSAFSTLFIGLLLLISRTKAITQVVGYLVMENGIFLFALLLFDVTPLLVELGIFLDIFVGVFIMGIVINHIQNEFDHTDTSQFTALKG